jgi:methionyl aminopeptidase
MGIIIKSEREIAIMHQAGRIVAAVLEILCRQARPGIRTKELDVIAAREVERLGAKPSFKGYRVSLDLGATYMGFQGDAAVTVGVGEISPLAQDLVETTEEVLKAGISAVHPGVRLGDISAAMQDYAESRGYSVVREYSGHGIGREMHEEPQIPNFGLPGTGPVLRKGMTLALEPMINVGDWRTRLGDDRWTVLTADGSLSAHFEHTIAITDGEAEVLTAREGVYA